MKNDDASAWIPPSPTGVISLHGSDDVSHLNASGQAINITIKTAAGSVISFPLAGGETVKVACAGDMENIILS